MNVFEGDFVVGDKQLSYDQKCVIEEESWEQIQLAIKRGEISVEEAEVMLYEFHDRVQHLGDVSLQAI